MITFRSHLIDCATAYGPKTRFLVTLDLSGNMINDTAMANNEIGDQGVTRHLVGWTPRQHNRQVKVNKCMDTHSPRLEVAQWWQCGRSDGDKTFHNIRDLTY